jgi:hypothetical protein
MHLPYSLRINIQARYVLIYSLIGIGVTQFLHLVNDVRI